MTKIKILVVLLLALVSQSGYATRIKDIGQIKGVRENVLIGYGIVIGLKGSGDSGTDITSKSMIRLFEKLGIQNPGTEFKSKNTAAVIVTAKLPPFSRAGTKIDVSVASVGDASSIEGGTLLITPLKAGDQAVYAVAQGSVTLGSTTTGGGGGGGAVFPTSGRIAGGGLIEREIEGSFTEKKSYVLALNQPDFTTVSRIAKIINTELGGKYAVARDGATIDIIVPFNYEGSGVELLASIENMNVNPDTKAKVIVNEKTGTVVIGDAVRIDPVAVSHGDLTIEVGGGSKGPKERVGILSGSNLKEVVKALNTLGAKPQDLTAIFQALKVSGALHAELEII